MDNLERVPLGQATPAPVSLDLPGVASGVLPVDPEMVGLFRSRHRAARRHQAQLAQIRCHPDPAEAASGLAQQRIWARRHARQQRLKGSDLHLVRRSV